VTASLSPAVRDRLAVFEATLRRWNGAINLVSQRDLPVLWARHIEDSLQLAVLADPPPGRAIDLGSGAGFPGLVLAIATGMHVDLIEEDQRKCAFLREAARVTEAPVSVHAARIERVDLPPAPVLTARALAPVARLLVLGERLLAPGGACWFLKGRGIDAELEAAGREWTMRVERWVSRTNPEGVVLRLSGISRR
jgi:16S rRNA (guanine527-N7)-methyltransferase